MEIANLSVMALRLYVTLLHIGDKKLDNSQIKRAIKAKTIAEVEAAIQELYTAGLLDGPLYTLHFRAIPIAAITKTEAYGVGDGLIRRDLVRRIREMDALLDEGTTNHPSDPAYARRQQQAEVLRDAWAYLYPDDGGFPLVDAHRLINLCGRLGEPVLDFMFTAHDSPHNGPVKSPRALLRASIENALGIRQKPVAVAQPRRKPTKPALPWDNEPDQEIRQYAQRYHERNPRQSVEEAYQYAKAQIRANRAFPSRND